MARANQIQNRRTSVDEIFEFLYEDIHSLRLRPGDRISEAEVAAQFGVSRQPVRDAFTRLANLDLLVIRPQRATEVKRFSLREIEKSRFVRAAVEAEVLRRAAVCCDAAGAAKLDAALAEQRKALQKNDYQRFGALDYEFHRTLSEVAEVEMAFEVISAEKAKVDRLCLLSLSQELRMPQLITDHEAIADAVKKGDAEKAVDMMQLHLSRLDGTIEAIFETNTDYFEPDPD